MLDLCVLNIEFAPDAVHEYMVPEAAKVGECEFFDVVSHHPNGDLRRKLWSAS